MYKSVTAALILSATLYQPAGATVSDCATVENDLDRLACYDRESGRTPVTTTAPAIGKWKTRLDKSRMTDQTTVVLSVDAEQPVYCGSIYGNPTPTLIVRCSENTTAIYLSVGCHMTSSRYNSYGDVTYRLDDDKAKTRGFVESTDNKALGLWRGKSAIPFIKSMLGHDQMITRFTPFSESAVTATFNIAGLDKAVQPLREACNW